MLRADFLTAPQDWTRAQRTSQARADYANPITRHRRRLNWCDRALRVAAVLLVCAAGGMLLA